MSDLFFSLVFIAFTIVTYQLFAYIQKKLTVIWFNPMVLAIAVIIPTLLSINISFDQYYQSTFPLHFLLEPAVVALGFPLYQHLHSIKKHWQTIVKLLSLAALLALSTSYVLTMVFIQLPEIAVSLSLKSVTTPIGIALTEKLNGNSSITAFSIIIAGLLGAMLGPTWLNFIGVKSAKAQGLAIGAGSHALGTATISKISYEHGAYGSLGLIVSAVLTALLSPALIPYLKTLML